MPYRNGAGLFPEPQANTACGLATVLTPHGCVNSMPGRVKSLQFSDLSRRHGAAAARP